MAGFPLATVSANLVGINSTFGLFARATNPEEEAQHRESMCATLHELREVFHNFGLWFSEEAINNAIAALCDASRPLNKSSALFSCNAINHAVFNELKRPAFLYVSYERATYYDDPMPFGRDVADRFARASYDVAEASKCYALGRSTAAVFHGMRVVEGGLRAVFASLGLTLPPKRAQRTWRKLQDMIRDEIHRRQSSSVALPAPLSFYEEAQADILVMREAWRNPTMHLEKQYGDEQAKLILDASAKFMSGIAAVIDQDGKPV